uniref:Uncharacterized protein n=1 Tax=Romanomermis culicivorax TaxID=13658 RepID=A0A915HS65_ROMCU
MIHSAVTLVCLDNTFLNESIYFRDKKSKILLTFHNDAKSLSKIESDGYHDDVLQLNFATPISDTVDFEIWPAYASSVDLEDKCRIVERGTPEFNQLIRRMINESDAEKNTELAAYLEKVDQIAKSVSESTLNQSAKVTYLVGKSSYSHVETDIGEHQFYFPFDGIGNITKYSFSGDELLLELIDSQLRIAQISEKVTFEFQDGARAKFVDHTLIAYLSTAESTYNALQKINLYLTDSNDQYFNLVADTGDGRTILYHNPIPNNESNVMDSLIYDGGFGDYEHVLSKVDNYFSLFATDIQQDFKVDIEAKNSTTFINLSEVAEERQDNTKGKYGLHVVVSKDNVDIVLNIIEMPNIEQDEQIKQRGTITIKGGASCIENIFVPIYNTNYLRVIDGEIKLQPFPRFRMSRSIITIMRGDIDFYRYQSIGVVEIYSKS